jgi:N-acyl-D-aspartate/D-glutamate deacylase
MTVFSKDIKDTATYRNPTAPPKGIAQVYVEGQLIIENGDYIDKKPNGKLLRAGQI